MGRSQAVQSSPLPMLARSLLGSSCGSVPSSSLLRIIRANTSGTNISPAVGTLARGERPCYLGYVRTTKAATPAFYSSTALRVRPGGRTPNLLLRVDHVTPTRGWSFPLGFPNGVASDVERNRWASVVVLDLVLRLGWEDRLFASGARLAASGARPDFQGVVAREYPGVELVANDVGVRSAPTLRSCAR